jgi:hypothetical protein
VLALVERERERERKVSFIEAWAFSKPAVLEPMWYDAGMLMKGEQGVSRKQHGSLLKPRKGATLTITHAIA